MSRILVVDNEPDVLNTICGILRDDDHEVFGADSESEAIEIFTREEIEFAFVDLRLYSNDPGDISGISLAAIFQNMSPETKIFLVSGFQLSERVRRIMHYTGGIEFIQKDVHLYESIQQKISEHQISTELIEEETGNITSSKIRIDVGENETKLNISIAEKQPLVIRSRGKYVVSTRTTRNLAIDTDRLARRSAIIRTQANDWRFQTQEVGNDLWKQIFAENQEALRAFVASQSASSLLTITFETSRDDLRLPLEFMRIDAPSQHLVLRHPVSRFIYEAIPRRPPISPSFLAQTPALKVLLIASNTKPNIPEVDREIEALRVYFNEVSATTIPVQMKVLTTEVASIERVREELRQSDYDIIHYAGHGKFDTSSPEESFLSFWGNTNKEGGVEQLKATEFDWLLGESKARFVYLSSCFGTSSGSNNMLMDDDYLGLADAIVQAGIPTVLGYRWPVSDAGAARLSIAFYKALFEHGRPDIALWQARREISAPNLNDMTWLSPILIHQV